MEAVFHKPFEVMQFWCSDRFSLHQMSDGDLIVDLVVDEPEPGKWFFQVSNGPGTPFVGDTLPPFLPTKRNIIALHDGCFKAGKLLEVYKATDKLDLPDRSVFSSITPYNGKLVRSLAETQYRNDLFSVLRTDWGIELPPLDELGRRNVVLAYRHGLPCAAAMTRAVQPILEAVKGPLKRVRQAASHEGNKVFDTLEYQDSAGRSFTQRFDITEYFGKTLPNTNFAFEESVAETKTAEGINSQVVEEMRSIINIWATTKQAGHSTQEVANMLFFSATDELLPDKKFDDPIEFCDFLHFAKTGQMLSGGEIVVLGVYAQQKGLDVKNSPRIRSIATSLKGKKWWQFWK